MSPDNPLATELLTYQQNKRVLLAESEGRYVLISGDKILGVFDTERDALDEGYKVVGNKPFLVKVIAQFDDVIAFPVSLLQA